MPETHIKVEEKRRYKFVLKHSRMYSGMHVDKYIMYIQAHIHTYTQRYILVAIKDNDTTFIYENTTPHSSRDIILFGSY